MSGITPVSSYVNLDHTGSQTSYLTQIDGNSVAARRLGANFAPVGSTGMFVQLMPGHLYNGNTITEVSSQTSSTITAPVSNSRIDRLTVSNTTGIYNYVLGTPAGSPVAPAIPTGYSPVAQVLVASSATTLGNSLLTDERDFSQLGAAAMELLNYAIDTSSVADVYNVAPSPAISSYSIGMTVNLIPAHNNTGSSGGATLQVNTSSAVRIKMPNGQDPVANYLNTVGIYPHIFNGTYFIVDDGAVMPSSMLSPISSNSALVNASSAAGIPTPLALSTGTLLGVGSSNIIAVPLDATMKFTASSALAVNTGTGAGQIPVISSLGALSSLIKIPGSNSVLQSTFANPSGTNTGPIMVGLNKTFTPANTGRALVIITGDLSGTQSGTVPSVSIRYGSGGSSAPANGSSVQGTSLGAAVVAQGISSTPFTLQGIIQGMTVSSANWIDIALQNVPGAGNGTASVTNINMSVIEI